MRVVTDIDGLNRVAPAGTTVVVVSSGKVSHRWRRNWRLLVAAWRSDYLVIHFQLPEVIFFSAILSLWPGRRPRLVTLDFFVGNLNPMMRVLARWSLGRVDRFLVHFRDASILESKFGLAPGRFHYVPFKVNSLPLIQAAHPADEGYIFCGGRSRRDFRTLFAAAADLGYPVKVLTAPEEEMNPHGSSLRGLEIPKNVEVSYNDSDSAFFVRCLAGARLVVLPLIKDRDTQAGIAICLMAMALRKCVIVSAGLGISDVLLEDQAIIVPAGDVTALRTAIEEAWRNDGLREGYAAKGCLYAQALGGDDQLRRSVLEALSTSA